MASSRAPMILLVAPALAGCHAAAPAEGVRAGHELDVRTHSEEAPLADDAEVRFQDGECAMLFNRGGPGEILVKCAALPKEAPAVASVTACLRGDEAEQIAPVARRAGADTVVRLYTVTDSCVTRDERGKLSGTGASSYLFYRLRQRGSRARAMAHREACRAALAAVVRDDGRPATYFLGSGSAECDGAIADATSGLQEAGFDAFPWDPVFGHTTIHCAKGAERCDAIGDAARVGIRPVRDTDLRIDAPEVDLAIPEAAARCEWPAESHYQVAVTARCAFKGYDIVVTCDDGRFTARARTILGRR